MTTARGCSAGCDRPSASRRGKPGLCRPCIDDVFRRRRLEPLEPYPGVREKRACRCMECGEPRDVAYGDIRGMKTSEEHQFPACEDCAIKFAHQPTADEDREAVARRLKTLLIWGGETLRPMRASDLVNRDAWRLVHCGVCLTPQFAFVHQLIDRVERGEMPCPKCMENFDANWGLSHLKAEFAARQLEYLGEERMPRRTDPVPARCMLCGNRREISLDRLLKGAPPCVMCGDDGPDLSGPYWVYQFHFPHLGLRKVGITNARSEQRFVAHKRQGGRELARVLVTDRDAARRVEAKGLAMVSDFIDRFVDPKEFPQGGWTEVWSDSGPDLPLRRIAHELGVDEL